MKQHIFVAVASLLLGSDGARPTSEPAVSSTSSEEVLYLCQALAEAKPGERVPVRLRGVVGVGFEFQVFFDPDQPQCEWDVQPSTWIEFPASLASRDELFDLLEDSGNAYVEIRGELYGPPPLGADDPSMNPVASYANRIAGRRYGHMGHFRTELVVEEILDARPVRRDVAARVVTFRRPSSEELLVESAEVPHYPERARRAGISGEVVVRVAIEGGEVVSTELISGDRLLAMGAEADIKTWKFAGHLHATFTTTFVYRLELRPTGAHEGSRVELQLPRLVRITAPRYAW